jgi:hypothetical protein
MTDRSERYAAAVAYVATSLGDWLPALGDETTDAVTLRLTFRVRTVIGPDGSSYLDAPDTALDLLVDRALVHLPSRELIKEIVSSKLLAGRPLRDKERVFAGLAICGQLPMIGGKVGRVGGKNYRQSSLARHFARVVVSRFGLGLTRNDEGSAQQSACDAVLEAFRSHGVKHLTYNVLKRVCLDVDFGKRDEIILALQIVQEAGPPTLRNGLIG